MRKIYSIILTTLIASNTFGQNGQIQNGGFENWSDLFLYEAPNAWISQPTDDWNGTAAVLKSTDATHGMYSCELTAKEYGSQQDTTFGYVLQGEINEGPEGGIPYTSTFNQVTFDYKSDLPLGDTMYLLVIRYDAGGAVIEEVFKPVVYGTNTNWMNGNVSISSTPQAELFIGFVLGNVFEEAVPTPDSWARIDNVVLKNSGTTTANIPNFSFENWNSVSTEEADNWYSMNEETIGQGVLPVIKSTDANTGSYALELSTLSVPQWEDTIRGYLSIGEIDTHSPMPFTAIPYNASPTTFEYSYKYSGGNGDLSGGIYIQFFNMGANIGGNSVPFTDQATYLSSSIPLSYTGTPDSVSVLVFAGDSLGSTLTIDDLAFTGGNVGVEEFSKFNLDIYPNPANDYVMIKSENEYEIEIIDLTGKRVYNSKNNSGIVTINTEQYKKGAYFIKINTSQKTQTQKLIIQ